MDWRGVGQYRYGTRWGDMLTREKSNSRLNATKHGCCAKTLILPDECQEDFDRIHNGWMAEFEPEGYQEERLVEILILNDWHLQRAQRRLWEAEAALCAGPEQPMEPENREIWEAQRQHDLELKQRYKTSCERAFYRAWSVLQGLRKDIERYQVALGRLEAKKQKLERQLEAWKKKQGIESEPENRRHDALRNSGLAEELTNDRDGKLPVDRKTRRLLAAWTTRATVDKSTEASRYRGES